MVRAVALLGVWCALGGSQAFFLAPTTTTAPARGVTASTSGATGWTSSWCPRSRREVCCSSSNGQQDAKGRGRKGGSRGGALTMKKKVKNSLEEVSDELASKPVALECPKTGRTLVCYAERIAVVGGERYLVAFPKDPAVAIAFDENGEVSPVPNDDPIMDELFPLAEACVADLGPDVTLLRTPTTLTVKGLNELVEEKSKSGVDDVDEEENDDGAVADSLEGEEEDSDDEEEEDEEEEEEEEADEVELLGEFLLEGEEFLIVRFLEPILILAKEQTPGKYFLVDEEEEQDAIPLVDEMLCGDASL